MADTKPPRSSRASCFLPGAREGISDRNTRHPDHPSQSRQLAGGGGGCGGGGCRVRGVAAAPRAGPRAGAGDFVVAAAAVAVGVEDLQPPDQRAPRAEHRVAVPVKDEGHARPG